MRFAESKDVVAAETETPIDEVFRERKEEDERTLRSIVGQCHDTAQTVERNHQGLYEVQMVHKNTLMVYLVYKTTNNINGKYYIGAHQTNNRNDGYLGSGVLLNKAIEKYGVNKMKKITIPEIFSHIIDPKFERKHSKFIREQNKKTHNGGEFVYQFSHSSGIGWSITLENVKNHETLDLTDFDNW